MFRAGFLNDGDEHGQTRKGQQYDGFFRVAQQQIDDAATDQKGEHGFAKNLQNDLEDCAAILLGEFIWPVSCQARCRFGCAESIRLRRLKSCHGLKALSGKPRCLNFSARSP